MKGAETIVIGGGILGATTLWELAREDMAPLLLEAGSFAGGSTAKSGAIVRCHYSNPEVVRMAFRSRERLRQLPLHLDCDPVYTRTGWLFLVDAEAAVAAAENSLMQEEEGVDSIEVDDLDEFLPGAEGAGIAYALYEPESGFADPVATTLAHLEAAQRAGARAFEGMPVGGIQLAGDRVRGVRVGDEVIECDSVVLAAGAWSSILAYGIGLELPIEVTREQYVVYDVAPQSVVPCAVSSQVDRMYLRPAPDHGEHRMIAGRGYPKEYEPGHPDAYDETVDESFQADVRSRVVYRLPELAGMRAVGGRVGLYDVTPDWHPLLGPVDGYEGLYLATGGSGHCFKLSPAIGELVAGAIIGKPTTFADVETFSLSRFAEGRALGSSYGGNRA